LRLSDSKTGAKVVHLGPPALELFSKLQRIEGNPHVFPSSPGTGHFVGLYKVWKRIREKAKLPDVRIHDLRHSFASVGVASGDSLYIVGKLLGHTQARTTQRNATHIWWIILSAQQLTGSLGRLRMLWEVKKLRKSLKCQRGEIAIKNRLVSRKTVKVGAVLIELKNCPPLGTRLSADR
jgi:hypothetical protein